MVDNAVFDSQQSRPLQQTWMQLLPYDVVALVLENLNQHELLECMAVCASWYHSVPYYTTERWHTVKIFRHRGGLGNHRLARCLGEHVRRISLSGYETQHQLNQVLEDLVDLGCVWIESLEFYDTQVCVQQSFFALLSKLAIHALRQIAFLRHRGVLDFFKVVAACPHLTVFDFSASGDQGELEAYSMPSRSKITHMCLNGRPYDIHPQLELILRQCPHLRFLATNNPWIRSQENMDKLLQYCPRIEYFEYARHTRNARHYLHEHIQRLPNDQDDGCLRELVLDGYRAGNMPDPHMLTTLEILRLKTTLIRNIPPFSQSLDRLCILSCDQVLCDPPSILASLIEQCPSLEEITLRGFPLIPEICEALSNVSQLKRLYLFRNNHMRPGEGNILWTLLQSLHHRPLQCLQLEGVLNDHLIESLALPGNAAPHHHHHPQLTQLSISSKYLTGGALDRFITRSTCGILSRIKTLEICDINMISRMMLAALGDLDYLERLVLRRCRYVDGNGINDLLFHTKALHSLCIMHCDIPDGKETIRYAIKKLGEEAVLYIPWKFVSFNIKEER